MPQLRVPAGVLQGGQGGHGVLRVRAAGHAHPGVWQPRLRVPPLLRPRDQHCQENCQETGHVNTVNLSMGTTSLNLTLCFLITKFVLCFDAYLLDVVIIVVAEVVTGNRGISEC